jgi:hypothetical protein
VCLCVCIYTYIYIYIFINSLFRFVHNISALGLCKLLITRRKDMWHTEKLTVALIVRKFHVFYKTCVLTPATGHYLEPDESNPRASHPISLRPTLIVPSHLCLGLSSGLIVWGFLTNILYACHILHSCYMAHSYNPPWFDHPQNKSVFN